VDGGADIRWQVDFCVPVAVAATIIPPMLTMPAASNSYVELRELPVTVAEPDL
jgi:hypothetical protein